MSTVTIEEAQAKLLDLIHTLQPNEEVIITENNQPVARLIPVHSPAQRKPRQPGRLRGTVKYMAPDFDAPLEDFKELRPDMNCPGYRTTPAEAGFQPP